MNATLHGNASEKTKNECHAAWQQNSGWGGARGADARTHGRTHAHRATAQPPSNAHRKKIRRSGHTPPHSDKKLEKTIKTLYRTVVCTSAST